MGVGFRHIGKVVEVHVRRTYVALGLTCRQQSLFYTHSATFSLYCGSRMGRRYRAK